MTKHFLEMTTEEREYQLDCANTFLKWTREDIKDVTKSFFRIGFRLYEARAYKYYEALGYPDIETLAEEEFGFKRSSTYGFMQVYERVCIKHGHNTMDEKYIGYDYSKLLELCKVKYSMDTLLQRIKPTDSVRNIRQYIRFWNDYSVHHSGDYKLTLQEWKAEQEKLSMLPPVSDNKQIEGQISITDTIPNEQQPDTDINIAPTAEQPAETVQTFGLPTCAEPEQTETVIKPGEETPIYNLKARDSVRVFLKDYRNWAKGYGFYGAFIEDMYFAVLKNRVTVWALVTKIVVNPATLESAETVTYFIDDDKRKAKMITKEQFEKYCAEHKDEL